jgi:ribosomal protein L40E
VSDDGRRCPTCGALVAADAAWCGQCFTPLVADAPADAPAAAAAGPEPDLPRPDVTGVADAPPAERAAPYWPCSVCGGRNPIEAETCRTCGTPFASVMRSGPERPEVAPRQALTWSLVFPGLGLAKCGRPSDGFARGVLFGVCLGMAVLIGLGGARSSPATFAVFSLFVLCALGVYALAAWEAYRVADGEATFVSSRVLLWALSGIILVGVGLLGLAVVSSGRG